MGKTLPKLFAASSIIAASLIPFGLKAHALTYEPGYTCYYRDVSGSCLSYQTSNPYIPATSYGTYGNPYGNSMTYPYTSSVTTPWDYRYSQPSYYTYPTTNYRSNVRTHTPITHYNVGDGDWRWYYDQDDNRVRQYRYQSGDNYENKYYYGRYGKGNHYEYEHTKITCDGRDCDTTNYRY